MNLDNYLHSKAIGTGRIQSADLNAEMRLKCDVCGKHRNRGYHDKCSKIRQARRNGA